MNPVLTQTLSATISRGTVVANESGADYQGLPPFTIMFEQGLMEKSTAAGLLTILPRVLIYTTVRRLGSTASSLSGTGAGGGVVAELPRLSVDHRRERCRILLEGIIRCWYQVQRAIFSSAWQG